MDWSAGKETAVVYVVGRSVRETIMEVKPARCILLRVTWWPAAGHMLPARCNYYVTQSAVLGACGDSGVMSNAISTMLLLKILTWVSFLKKLIFEMLAILYQLRSYLCCY